MALRTKLFWTSILVHRRRNCDGLVCAQDITANQAGLANHIEANSSIPLIRGDIPGARLIPQNLGNGVLVYKMALLRP